MLRRTLLAAAAFGAMMAAAPAEAVVTYTLVDGAFGPAAGQPSAGGAPRTSLVFTVSDAAVARGSFNLSFAGSGNSASNSFSGDIGDFVSLAVESDFIALSFPFRASRSTLSVAFAPNQDVTTLSLSYLGDVHDLSLSPSGIGLVSGRFVSDFNGCGASPTLCSVTGRIARTPVPEPMSLALLGIGLLGITAMRRQR